MKLRMLVGLLSAMSFFHFGELWPAGSHGGGITFEISYMHIVPGENAYMQIAPGKKICGMARWAVGIGRGSVVQSELGRRRRIRPYGGICVLQAC